MKLKNVLNPIYVYKNRDLIQPTLKGRYKRYLGFYHRWFRTLGIPLTANDRRVAALKDKHRGNRCFIIGSGPSLKIEDLDRLKDEITFGCNKIYLAFDQTEWRPTYYSILDVLVAENNKTAINELKLCKIFREDVRPYFSDAEDIIWLKSMDMPIVDGEYEGRFSVNALEGVYGGWTVLYPQIQLAFFMGIREIYLIGVDFSFDVPKSTGKKCQSGEILEHQGETNHFHPEYRMPGETWTIPLLDLQYKAFLAAKKAVENRGSYIFNASRKTALDVFPCVDFDHVLTKKSSYTKKQDNLFHCILWVIKNAHVQSNFTLVKQEENNIYARLNNKNVPKVSIIITNYNYGHFLKKAINSALLQKYNNKEVIVVDDGSTDNSTEILDSYKDSIVAVTQENKGQAAAFNSGFNHSSGDILCFLDADDFWETHKLDRIVKKFQEERWGMVSHDLKIEGKQRQTNLYSKLIKTPFIEGNIYPDFLKKGYIYSFIPTSGLSINRNIANKIFPLHEKGWQICADTQIAFCCASLAPIGYIYEALGTYRIHNTNQYSSGCDEKPSRIKVRNLINTMLCYRKLTDLFSNTNRTAISPLENYIFLRKWKFMTSKLNIKLLFLLWKENIIYFNKNRDIYYKKTAISKFIIFDTIIFLFLIVKIPCSALKLRNTYTSKFSSKYDKLFTDFTKI